MIKPMLRSLPDHTGTARSWLCCHKSHWLARAAHCLPRWTGIVIETARVGQNTTDYVRITFSKLNDGGHIV